MIEGAGLAVMSDDKHHRGNCPDRSGRSSPIARASEDGFYRRGLPVRQNIESCYQTFKGQLSLERHHARSLTGLTARVLQRICALASTLWLNRLFGQPGRRLTAYDH